MSALATLLLAAAIGSDPGNGARLLLAAGLEPEDVRAVVRGEVVARVLDARDASEVLSVAAVRVRAPLARLAAHLRDPRGPAAAGEALLSGGADPASLEALRLDARDVSELRDCRVGDCSFRLSREAIERLRLVDGKAPGVMLESSAALQGLLLDNATAYAARGDAALMPYHDDPVPVSIAASLSRLTARFAALDALAPELKHHLRGFPDRMPGVEDVLYWQRDRFWRKQVLSLNHRALRVDGDRLAAATKQLWASHFFESSLGLVVAVQDAPGLWLAFVNHSRADIRPSGFNFLERILIKRLVRGRLHDQLGSLRAYLEAGAEPPGDTVARAAGR